MCARFSTRARNWSSHQSNVDQHVYPRKTHPTSVLSIGGNGWHARLPGRPQRRAYLPAHGSKETSVQAPHCQGDGNSYRTKAIQLWVGFETPAQPASLSESLASRCAQSSKENSPGFSNRPETSCTTTWGQCREEQLPHQWRADKLKN